MLCYDLYFSFGCVVIKDKCLQRVTLLESGIFPMYAHLIPLHMIIQTISGAEYEL
jgi:hypothetical protein